MLRSFRKEIIVTIYVIAKCIYFLYAFYPGNHITVFWSNYYFALDNLFVIWVLIELKKRSYLVLFKRLVNVAISISIFTLVFFTVKTIFPQTVKTWKDQGYINNAILILTTLGLTYVVIKQLKLKR